MLIMAAACGASGYFFVNYVFQTSMERETRQALDESSILRFAFETAALNIPSKYDVLPDGTVEQIGVYLENSGQHGNRLLRISDENGKVLYASEGFTGDTSLWEERGENTRVYRVVQSGDSYYIQTQTRINVSDRLLTLETMKNVTAVYTERTEGFRMYGQVRVIVLLCSGAVMTLIACWLTRPIRRLTRATGKMAEGEYSYRAEQISNDEMGQLTADFNHMAEALEQNIQNLENEVRAREDFIAAFSHELKTPLTAMIGYADMLRSRKLDDEKHFLCANYIYTEGKRLETMALRLLDIIVTRRKEIDRKTTNVSGIFSYLQEIYDETKNPEDGRVKVDICWEKGELYAEENLLKTVLINLTDNAIKASEEGQTVEITGRRMENGYYSHVSVPRSPFWKRTINMGFKNVLVVKEQDTEDGNFPTVKSPNPEDKEGFEIAIKMAKENDVDVIIGTDPDCDRVGIVVRDADGIYRTLTGNQTGALLVEYILSSKKAKGTLPENGVVIKTIVTTELAAAIAHSYGIEIMNVLTGFKYIGEKMTEFAKTGDHTYLIGFEESYGYLVGTHARDKDGVVATMLIAEMAVHFYLFSIIDHVLKFLLSFLILDKSIAECLFFRSPQIPEIRSKLPPKGRTREEAVACPLMKEGTQRLTKPNGGASHRPGAFDCSKWDRLLMYKIIWPCAENTGPYNFRKYLRLGDKMKVKFSTNYIFAKHSGEKTKYMPSSAKIDKTATNLPYFQGVISTCAFS